MYVCICHAVTEETVRSAIADGAGSVAAVTKACRAGGDCGACREMIGDLIEEHADCPRDSLRHLPIAPIAPGRAA